VRPWSMHRPGDRSSCLKPRPHYCRARDRLAATQARATRCHRRQMPRREQRTRSLRGRLTRTTATRSQRLVDATTRPAAAGPGSTRWSSDRNRRRSIRSRGRRQNRRPRPDAQRDSRRPTLVVDAGGRDPRARDRGQRRGWLATALRTLRPTPRRRWLRCAHLAPARARTARPTAARVMQRVARVVCAARRGLAGSAVARTLAFDRRGTVLVRRRGRVEHAAVGRRAAGTEVKARTRTRRQTREVRAAELSAMKDASRGGARDAGGREPVHRRDRGVGDGAGAAARPATAAGTSARALGRSRVVRARARTSDHPRRGDRNNDT
jgi:hypothetical protein